jgi:hypothetical protein
VTLDNRGREADAVDKYQRALHIGLRDRNTERQAMTWLASSLSKLGRHEEAIRALHLAEGSGGYDPAEEFERIRRSIRRRSEKLGEAAIERGRLKERLHVIDGLLRAFDVAGRILDLVLSSTDRTAVHRALLGAPFSFSEIQAHHVLDAPLGRFSLHVREDLEDEARKFRQALDALAAGDRLVREQTD